MREVMCPICLTRYGRFNKMIYDKKDACFKCLECKAEVWPDRHEPDELEKFMRDMADTHYTPEPLPAGQALKGRGGSSNGKSRKPPNNKKSLSQINATLAPDYHNH